MLRSSQTRLIVNVSLIGLSLFWTPPIRGAWGSRGTESGPLRVESEIRGENTGTDPQFSRLCQEGKDCLLKNEPSLRALGLDIEAIATRSMMTSSPSDLADSHSLLRATLSVRKLLKYCQLENFEKLDPGRALLPGKYDERSPWVGKLATDLERLEKIGGQTPELIAFARALYVGGSACSPHPAPPEFQASPAHFWMIPSKDASKAEALADAKLKTFFETQDPKRSSSEAYEASSFRAGVTHVYDIDNDWNDWTIHVTVDPNGISTGQTETPLGSWSVPASVVAIHELAHVSRIPLGSPDHPHSEDPTYLEELGPVIEQIILQDEIAKKLGNIPLEKEIPYPCSPAKFATKPLPLGLLANHFRTLTKKYGGTESALLSPEGMAIVREYFQK